MWISVILQADATRAEALSEALMEHGALSVSIDDADAGTEDRKSTRLNSSHSDRSRMPSSA